MYDDDIVFTGTSPSIIEVVIQPINDEFKLKNLENINFFFVGGEHLGDNYLLLNMFKIFDSKLALLRLPAFLPQ